MRITIPDDLADAIQASLRGPQTLEGEITRRLEKTLAVSGGAPFLLLTGTDLDAYAQACNRTLPPATVPQLLSYAERLASVSFGEIKIQFSQGQLEELQRLASREGQSLAQYIGRVAATFTSNFFRVHPAAVEVPVVEVIKVVEAEPTPA